MNFNVISPETTEELLQSIAENQSNKFRFGAGYTDLIPELKQQPDQDITVINLANLNNKRFTSIERGVDGIRIGALVTASRITVDGELQRRFPVLCYAANKLASRQIRQVATVGGNLCTASPAGDIACALMALEAQCEILSAKGTTVRVIPIHDFFIDVRKTDLKKDEILRSVFVPSNNEGETATSNFLKIGTRRSMECSVVSLAYHIQADDDEITHAGVAIGSVAPTIKFARSACDYLNGRKFSSMGNSRSEEFASKVLEYASPISDIRASAWYRKEVLFNISKSIFEKQT